MITRNILVLGLVLFSYLFVNGKEGKLTTDINQLYSQMALLSLDCINIGDSMPKQKILEIKNTLNEAKILQRSDSTGIYLKNLLELSYCYFIDKNYKRTHKRSNKLMPKYEKGDTVFYHIMHWDTPTWNVFHELSGLRLGKINFSLTIISDVSPNRERVLAQNILKEIPMNLDIEVYSQYLCYLKSFSASNSEISHLLFRALKSKKIDLANQLYAMMDFAGDSVKSNLFNVGLYGYAVYNGHTGLKVDMPYKLTPTFIRISGIKSECYERFATDICGNTGIWNIDEFTPLIKSLYGEGSREVIWLLAQNKSSLFNYDTDNFLEKIYANQILSDSVEVSKNVIKQMSRLNSKYDYKGTIDFGLSNKHLIAKEHIIDYLNILGISYRIIGLYNESISSFYTAIDLLKGKDKYSPVFIVVPSIEQLKTNLAYALSNAGKYEEALSVLDYEFPEESSFLGFTNHWNKISHLDDLGRVYTYLNPEKAEKLFEESQNIIDKNNYKMLPSNNIWHYLSWSFTQKRNSIFKRSLIAKAEQTYIDNNNLTKPWNIEPYVEGSIYFALGKYYYSVFDYTRASKYYFQAYNCYSELYPEDRRKTELILWDCLNRIAMRETDGIQTILESQLAMQDSLLGPNHYDCYQTVKGLLKLAIAENNYDLASQYYSRFKSMDGKFGREQFNYGNQLIESAVLSLLGNKKQAYEIADLVDLSECEASVGLQALEVKQSLTKSLPLRIQTTELQNINNSAKILSSRIFTEVSGQDRVEWSRQLGRLRSGFILNAITPEQIENALDFSLFTKGLLFRTNKYIINLIGKTKQGQNSLRELSVINDSINHYISLSDTIKSSDFKRRYEEEERDMVNRFLTPEVMLTGLQIGKKDAIKNIGKDGLGIDFVKYERNDSSYYGAFVFAENLPTTFLHLFAEKDLTKLITDDLGRRTYEAFDGKHGSRTLYELVWGKLIQFFEGRSDVYFSTDGEISQLGIEYLTDTKGFKIGNSVKLHRVFHFADLTGDMDGGKDIICMGVANHDFPVAHNGDDIDRGLWCNLNCDKEINDIRNAYKKKKGHKTFLIDDEVTEPFVQTLDNNSLSILHVSTHGFYYNQDKLKSYARSSKSPDHYLAIRSLQSGKTSLSGLVLRKGNEYRKLNTLPMGYDDIWTSDEIERLNFPKLQLTVLSACQTGLGETDSEGVWGLQRAFRIAGTQKLVCALDYVSDKRTREFMGTFYKNLSKGVTIYDSFHLARNQLFNRHRDDPRMWSAFVLIE